MKIIVLCGLLFTFVNFTNNCSSENNGVAAGNSAVTEAESSINNQIQKISSEKTPADLVWQGTNTEFEFNWSRENILVKKIASGEKVFSAKEFALKHLKNDFKSNFGDDGEPYFEDFTFRYKIISISGNLLTLDEKTSYSPQSYMTERYLTVDLDAPEKAVALADFYDEKEIVNALLSNELIAKKMNREKIKPPISLENFRSVFHSKITEAKEVTKNQLDKCWFPEDVFKSFAFAAISGEKVSVRLAIPCRAEMREDDVYPLELSMSLPEKLRQNLIAAADKNLLANDFSSVSEKGETLINFKAAALDK